MDPILIDVPSSFETENLTIRNPQPGDGAALNDAVIESMAELRPWMPWAQKAPTLAESEAEIRRGHSRFLAREDLWLLLYLKGSTTLVGCSGLHRPNWEIPSFEIGYWVRTSYAGQGYITEAVQGISNFAFDELNATRLTITCDSRNKKSANVAKRAGFLFEGTNHCDSRDPLGGLRDTLYFSKLKDDE